MSVVSRFPVNHCPLRAFNQHGSGGSFTGNWPPGPGVTSINGLAMKTQAADFAARLRWKTLLAAGAGLALVATATAQAPRPGQQLLTEGVFRQLDANRDGKLSPQEFTGLARISPRLRDNPDRVEETFKQADANSDGSVTPDEFRRFSEMAARLQPPPGASPAAQMEARLTGGFTVLDTNNDRKVSRQEFERIGQFQRQLEGDPTTRQLLFNELDGDNDSELTLVEFRGLARLIPGPQPPAPATPKPAVAERPPTQEEVAFFEKKIRPVLVDKCYSCHSADADKVKGSLVLDTREGARRGGDQGPAVVPGDLEASLLIKAIRYHDSDLQMPPEKNGGKLASPVIADFEQWVRMGAPDPREGKSGLVQNSINIEKGREHWAFQLPKKSAPPAVKDTAWPKSDIDRHVLAELEKRGLKPVGDADKRTLIRRVYFDLIGLPPAPEEVEAFVNDTSPDAFARVVDNLLVKPQFGERWGRHWLDVARYAESSGKENNIAYPHAWRYRDYVIRAFDRDKPYDEFLMEQIAGDLMAAKDDTDKAWKQIATGYLAIGPKSHNTRDPRQFQLDLVDEQIDALTQGMLGLTVACARCHDHKFDPIPQADYYAMAGIFMSTETRFGTPRFIQNNQTTPLIALPEKANIPAGPPLPERTMTFTKRQLEEGKAARDEVLAEAKNTRDRGVFANPRFIRSGIQISISEQLLGRYDDQGNPKALAMGAQERMFARDAQLLQRGELDKPQQVVPRGFVQVVNTGTPPPIRKGSGRLELAQWIASPENPLTARVMANRVWLHLFDTGLVPSPDNFGVTGQPPSHPALLDHLAISFVENGWSVKKLIREIVLSRTYQLSSAHADANYAADPDNTWLWRMSKRRLDAEAIRDAMLFVAGALDMHPVAGSPIATTEGPVLGLQRLGVLGVEQPVRSVYLPIVRDQVPESLDTFDFAEASLVTGDREVTSVPSQALFLMNSSFVQRVAEGMAGRLLRQNLRGQELAKAAFQLAFGRPPNADELQAALKFFESFNAAEGAKHPDKDRLAFAGLSAFCQALIGSAEFRYLN
jgi:Ca2+-binding EF-hand superfamily protein